MLTDADGELHRLDLASEINWNGWRKVTAKIPDDIALPAKLTKIYVVQPDKNLHTKGAVYFDDLTVSVNPAVSITAGIEKEKILINRLANLQLKKELNKSGASLNLENTDQEFKGSIELLGNTKTVRNGIAVLQLKDFKNSSLTWLNDSITSAEEKTIVIIAEGNPKNEPALIPIITAMKNKNITPVFVYKSSESNTEIADDVNYVSLRSAAPSVTKHTNTIDLFNIYVKDGKTEFKTETINLW
jgi:alpha-glucosidase (family GH31 glycosyl hydrolase)